MLEEVFVFLIFILGISDTGGSSYNKYSSEGSMGSYNNDSSGGFAKNRGASFPSSFQSQPVQQQSQQQPVHAYVAIFLIK